MRHSQKLEPAQSAHLFGGPRPIGSEDVRQMVAGLRLNGRDGNPTIIASCHAGAWADWLERTLDSCREGE